MKQPELFSQKPKPVLAHRCELGEGPVWDDRTGSLIWVDILGGTIHDFNVATGKHHQIKTQALVGAVALCTNGHLLAALDTRLELIHRDSGKRKPQTALEHIPDGIRFNDGKCDPAGRFWIGTMPLSEDRPIGALYCLEPDGDCKEQLRGITISNGLAWNGAGTTMYYIDTPTRAVQAFDFNPETGALTNRRIAFGIPESEGFPDGMTIDSEDKLWIAHWGGWQVARWDPETGRKLGAFRLPAAQITSCSFGGPDGEDLYITSASKGLTPGELEKQPLAGSLFVVKNTGFGGRPADRFAFEPKFDNP